MTHRQRASIVSGYFNPIHVGHLRMMEAARAMTGRLIVIVNNDTQQMLKKGRIILPLDDRMEVVRALRVTDEAIAAVDEDPTVKRTLRVIRERHPDAWLIFANGGDRSSAGHISEAQVCEELGIELAFGVGGEDKADSSSRIIAALDGEKLSWAAASGPARYATAGGRHPRDGAPGRDQGRSRRTSQRGLRPLWPAVWRTRLNPCASKSCTVPT